MLVGLLSNETTTFDGKYYQLKDARNEPKATFPKTGWNCDTSCHSPKSSSTSSTS